MKPQDNEKFYTLHNTTKEKLAQYNLSITTLLNIYNDHIQQAQILEQTAILLASAIQKIPNVHSVRWRIKDASHLISKIIRKHEAESQKYKNINVSNYRSIIQDLIGLRALHLYKSSVLSINDEIKKTLNVVDGPTAYIRQGDSTHAIKEKGFTVEEHADAYRSVHYIVKSTPFKIEIHSELQVRTIFEEGWAEIDHDVRYPNYSDNALVRQFLGIFNRLCGGADEMGDFVKTLTLALSTEKKKVNEPTVDPSAQIKAMKDDLSTLSPLASSKEQVCIIQNLQKNLNELESSYSQVVAISQSAIKSSYKDLEGWALAARLISDVISASAAAEKAKKNQYNIMDMEKHIPLVTLPKKNN